MIDALIHYQPGTFLLVIAVITTGLLILRAGILLYKAATSKTEKIYSDLTKVPTEYLINALLRTSRINLAYNDVLDELLRRNPDVRKFRGDLK